MIRCRLPWVVQRIESDASARSGFIAALATPQWNIGSALAEEPGRESVW